MRNGTLLILYDDSFPSIMIIKRVKPTTACQFRALWMSDLYIAKCHLTLNKPSLFVLLLDVVFIMGGKKKKKLKTKTKLGENERKLSHVETQHKSNWPIIIKIKTSKASQSFFRQNRNFSLSAQTFFYVSLHQSTAGKGGAGKKYFLIIKKKEIKENSFFIQRKKQEEKHFDRMTVKSRKFILIHNLSPPLELSPDPHPQ